MGGFYLTFLAVLLAGIGARDQNQDPPMTPAHAQPPPHQVNPQHTTDATAAFAAWAAISVIPLLAPRARTFFIACPLVFAGGESLLVRPRSILREPTLSLGALGFALVALQAVDAARFLVFAMAVATRAPLPAGLAGAIGGAVIVASGWFVPAVVLQRWTTLVRRVVGGVLLAIGVVLAAQVLLDL
jgi:hypothetical protein